MIQAQPLRSASDVGVIPATVHDIHSNLVNVVTKLENTLHDLRGPVPTAVSDKQPPPQIPTLTTDLMGVLALVKLADELTSELFSLVHYNR